MQCPTNASARPSTILTNTTVSTWVSDTSQAGYSYHADITHPDITVDMPASVIFSPTDASSGNYAPICQTGTGYVRIFSKVNTTITIPTVKITPTTSFTSLDNSPTNGSTLPITSGGVYDNCFAPSSFKNATLNTTNVTSNSTCRWKRCGNLVVLDFNFLTTSAISSTWMNYTCATGVTDKPNEWHNVAYGDNGTIGWVWIDPNGNVGISVRGTVPTNGNVNGQIVYFCA